MSLIATPTVQWQSSADEDFLIAEMHVAGHGFFELLKREEAGPVYVAFFKPGSREEILVDLGVFIEKLQTVGAEVRALKNPEIEPNDAPPIA